jgi:copper chaperone CopZ
MILTVAVASMFLVAGTAFACDGTKGYTKTKSCDGTKGYTETDADSKMIDATMVSGKDKSCDGNKSYTKTKSCDGTKGYTKSDAAVTDAKMVSADVKGKTTMLNVSNMTCGGCVSHVTKTLGEIDGVNDVTVSLDKGTAEVVYDADKIQPAMLTAAVVKAGYPAKLADADMTDAKTADAKSGKCDPAACAGKKSASKGACSGGMKTAVTTPDGN